MRDVQSWCKTASAIALCVAFAPGCKSNPEDVREWTPKDHKNTSNNAATPNGQVSAAPPAAEAPPKGLDPVTLTTWGTQCASCHGRIGRGDGPNGRMLKAKDLSDPAWQASITDEQIRTSITSGKNAMPAFANLPPETLENLVWLVRWFNRDQSAMKARMTRPGGESDVPSGATNRPTTPPSAGTGTTPSPATTAKQP